MKKGIVSDSPGWHREGLTAPQEFCTSHPL